MLTSPSAALALPMPPLHLLAAGELPGLDLLGEMTLVVLLAVIAAVGLKRFKIPSVVGYLLVGALCGPSGLRVIDDPDRIALVAEIGVILLLFTVGMKLSLKELVSMKRLVLVGGGVQVGLTIAIVAGLAKAFGWSLAEGIFLGYLVALSSTALVMKLLEDRGEASAPHGRLAIGTLLMQDLAVVPMFLSIPLLAPGVGSHSLLASLGLLGRSLLLLVGILVAARIAMPWLLRRVIALQSREIFTLTVNLSVLGTALLVGLAGLSMPLGAFLAGIVASESEYGQQILDQVTPLRDVFNSLFFVSVGMLVAPDAFTANPGVAFGLIGALIGLKLATAAAAGAAAGLGWRRALAGGIALAQIGEFSFVIAAAGLAANLIDGSTYARFLGVAVPSMLLTPFMLMLTPLLLRRRRQAGEETGPGAEPADAALAPAAEGLDGHVILIGCGVNGRRVLRALQLMKVDRVVVELNPRTARALEEEGERTVYGDATNDAVLEACGVRRARSLVVSGSDAASLRGIVARAHVLNPSLEIIVRTRFLREVGELTKLGADRVVVEEVEASLELVATVMEAYGAPAPVIARERALLRAQGYRLLRPKTSVDPDAAPGDSVDGDTSSQMPTLAAMLDTPMLDEVELPSEWSLRGSSLRSLDLRRRSGSMALAVLRGGAIHGNPAPDMPLEPGDVVMLSGTASQIDNARDVLLGQPAE